MEGFVKIVIEIKLFAEEQIKDLQKLKNKKVDLIGKILVGNYYYTLQIYSKRFSKYESQA